MKHLKYSYRLYPTPAQEAKLRSFTGAQRWVWNHFLDLEQQEYNATSKFRFKHKNITDLPGLKKEVPWLTEIPSTSLQQTLMQLDDALRRSFKSNAKRKGFPKFKKKKFHQGSFSLTMVTSKLLTDDSKYFKMPKIGKMRIKMHRSLPSDFKSCVVKQKSGQWHVVFTVTRPRTTPASVVSNAVGLDLNSKNIVVTSDNVSFKNPKFYAKSKRKLKKENRNLSTKHKGSRNWTKQLLRLQRAHTKVSNQRTDFLHKLSSALVNEHDLISMETLNVAGMAKFNGHMVNDAGWSALVAMIEYKCDLYGKHFVQIDRWFPSTKMCSACGQLHNKSLSDRDHNCDCGFVTTRDHNAAINIRNEGLLRAGTVQINACGDTAIRDNDNSLSRYVSSNQEAA